MNWSDFQRDLKNGTISNLYTFAGKDAFLKERALSMLRERVLPKGFEALNDTTLENASVQQITEAAETFPLMAERRLLVVVDWKPAIEADTEAAKQEVSAMEAWLKAPPETCIIVFFMKKDPDKRRKATTLLKDHTAYIEFGEITSSELMAIAQERLNASGKTIDQRTLDHLAIRVNQDLTAIMSELDKLSAYIGERKRIEKADIDAITSPALEYSIFRVVDLLLRRDLSEAQQIVNSLVQNGEAYSGILAVLTYQYRNLLHIRLSLDAGVPIKQIQDTLRISQYAAKQNANASKNADARRLESGYHACMEAEAGIKLGQLNEKKALEQLLIRLAM